MQGIRTDINLFVLFSLVCDRTYLTSENGHGSRRYEILNGTVTSMNYPNNYANDVYCKYLISTSKAGYGINITFQDFNVQYSLNCSDDVVSIFDGDTEEANLLGSYCGTRTPPYLISSGNKMLIVLKSNAILNSKGFRLSYNAGN